MNVTLLLRLPVELHLRVIDNLELHDKARLSSTCHFFKAIVGSFSHQDFLNTEKDERATTKNLFACKGCVRFRQFGDFADDMRKGKRSRHGLEAHTRMCLNCGMNVGLYAPGMHLLIYNNPHVVCRSCERLTDQIGSPGLCKPCSPLTQEPSKPSYLYDRRFEHDYVSTRSSRFYSERMRPEEFDESWHDA